MTPPSRPEMEAAIASFCLVALLGQTSTTGGGYRSYRPTVVHFVYAVLKNRSGRRYRDGAAEAIVRLVRETVDTEFVSDASDATVSALYGITSGKGNE